MQKKEKDYTGFIGDCSENQLNVLEEFKKIVYDELGLPNPPYDDMYLLRFCRARKFDIKKVEEMFKNFIKWRQENNVDEIDKFEFDELDDVKELYPHGYHKTCKLGRPIYIERLGKLKLSKLFEKTDQDRLLKYYIQSYETLVHNIFNDCTLAKGEVVQQSFTILDLTGAGISMATKKTYSFVNIASKMCQDSYPEILGQMFIINTPMLFSGVWAIVKPWLDDKTKAKIKILGSNYKKTLLEYIDEENLPDFLGGKSQCDLGQNIGPWNPDGSKIYFGKLKNVSIDRVSKNDYEYLKNRGQDPQLKTDTVQNQPVEEKKIEDEQKVEEKKIEDEQSNQIANQE